MYFDSTEAIENYRINTLNDIVSCGDNGIEGGVGGGKFFNGIVFDNNKIKSAKCAGLKLAQDVYNFKKDTLLNNTCHCEIVSNNGPILKCPPNKYLRTYYPLLNKGLCCTPCTSNSEITTTDNSIQCYQIYKDNKNNTVQCPSNGLIKSIIQTSNPSIECCRPNIGGTYAILQEKLTDECKKLNITNCHEEEIKKIKEKCQKYGIQNCNIQTIQDIENKCNSYGMKYYDMLNNRLQNNDSQIECNIDNFSKLDRLCEEENIKDCKWSNIEKKKLEKVQSIQDNLKKIQEREIQQQQLQQQQLQQQQFNREKNYKIIVVILLLVITILCILMLLICIKKTFMK